MTWAMQRMPTPGNIDIERCPAYGGASQITACIEERWSRRKTALI